MKTFFAFLISLFFVGAIFSQTCDIQTPGIEATPFTIAVGQTSNLMFSVFNNANGGSCQYAAQSVMVIISLPPNGVAFQSVISPPGGIGSFFNWVYSPGSNVVIGINQVPLGDGNGELVTMRVIGTALPSYPTNRQVNINVIQNPSGPIFPSNNPGNDNGQTTITITAAPLPITLTSFNVRNGECGEAKLDWTVEKEVNSDFISLERSTDGSLFEPIYKVKSLNSGERREYTFLDKNLVSGQQYLYRLNQVDLDGRSEIFTPISLKAEDCNSSDYDLVVFPNPALDRTTVSIKGARVEDHGNVVIINNIGQSVITIPYTGVNTVIDVKVHNLPPGIYTVGVENNNLYPHKRFIKIE